MAKQQRTDGSGTLRLLVDGTFGPFFVGRLTSHLAVWVYNIAAAVIVFQFTESAVAVAFVTVSQFVPQILVSAWGGSLSDRYDRRKMLLVGRAPAGLACWVVAAALILTDDATIIVWTIYVVGVVSGFAWGVGVPAGHALIPALVPRELLSNAIGLTSITGNVARSLGPAVAAGLLLIGEPWLAFFFAGLGHLVFAAVLVRLRNLEGTTPPKTDTSKVWEGVRYVFKRQRMWLPLVAGGVAGFGVEPILTLGPPLATMFGRPESDASLLATAFGTGAIVAALLLGRVRRRLGLELTAVVGYLLLGLPLVGVVFAPTLGLALVGLFVAGSGLMLTSASLQAQIQRRVDDAYRGRVMALWSLAFLGSRPVAAIVLGTTADLVGPRAGVAVAAGACVIGAVVLTQAWLRWGRPATERTQPRTPSPRNPER